VVHGVLVVLEELFALLQDLTRVRLQIDVEPELFVSTAPGILPGDSLD